MRCSTSGPCGKLGNKLFTAPVVRARRKNAGIAGPTSNFSNAAMAAVASIRVTELSKQPTSYLLMLVLGIFCFSSSLLYAQVTDLPTDRLSYTDSLNNECIPNSPADGWGWNGVCSCRVDQSVENFGKHIYSRDDLIVITATQVPGSCFESGSASVYELADSGSLAKVAELVSSDRVREDNFADREARRNFAVSPITVSDDYVVVGGTTGTVTVFSRDNWQEVTTIETNTFLTNSTKAMFFVDSLVVIQAGGVAVYDTTDWSLKQEITGISSFVGFAEADAGYNSGRFATGNTIYEQNAQGIFEPVFNYSLVERAPGVRVNVGQRLFDGNILVHVERSGLRTTLQTWYKNESGDWVGAPLADVSDLTRKFYHYESIWSLVDGQLAVFSQEQMESSLPYFPSAVPRTSGFDFYALSDNGSWTLFQSIVMADIEAMRGVRPPQVIGNRIAWEGIQQTLDTENVTGELRSQNEVGLLVFERDDQLLWSLRTYKPPVEVSEWNEFNCQVSNPYLCRSSSSTHLTHLGPMFRTGGGAELLVPVSNTPSVTTGCDYSDAHLYGGWGWNATTSESCSPLLSIEPEAQCIDSDGDGYGWNGTATCIPESNTVVTNPSVDSNCDYSDADLYGGWGWNATASQSCAPLENIIESQPTTQCVDTDGDGWGWNGSASCIP